MQADMRRTGVNKFSFGRFAHLRFTVVGFPPCRQTWAELALIFLLGASRIWGFRSRVFPAQTDVSRTGVDFSFGRFAHPDRAVKSSFTA